MYILGGETPSKENVAMTPPNAQWRKEREHDDEELFFSKEDDDEIVGKTPKFVIILNHFSAPYAIPQIRRGTAVPFIA